jgi:hypothetical protein
MRAMAAHSRTQRPLDQEQVEVEAAVCRVAGGCVDHGSLRGGRHRCGCRGWLVCGQAQAQQHRMAQWHMASMCVRVTAVVEDMCPVEHGSGRAVHGQARPSRGLSGESLGRTMRETPAWTLLSAAASPVQGQPVPGRRRRLRPTQGLMRTPAEHCPAPSGRGNVLAATLNGRDDRADE